MKRILSLLAGVVVVVVASAQLETLPDLASQLPREFRHTFLGVATWQWIGLLVVLGIATLAGSLARSATKRLTTFRDRFAPKPMEQATRAGICRGAGILAAALLSQGLVGDLNLPAGFERDVVTLAQVLVVFSTVLILYGWWDAACDSIAERAAGHRRAERLLVPMMRKFVRAVILTAGILSLVWIYGGAKQINALIGAIGLSGLVIALAAKDSVENFFGSLTILFDMPFALGDWVRIDKVEGIVEQINLRSTRIRTFEDSMITLPNANLIRASVENFGARRSRRQKLDVRMSYDTDPSRIEPFCQAIRDYLAAQPEVVQGRTIVEVQDMSETSFGILVQTFFDVSSQAEELRCRDALITEILAQHKKLGVLFAAAPRPPDSEPGAKNSPPA